MITWISWWFARQQLYFFLPTYSLLEERAWKRPSLELDRLVFKFYLLLEARAGDMCPCCTIVKKPKHMKPENDLIMLQGHFGFHAVEGGLHSFESILKTIWQYVWRASEKNHLNNPVTLFFLGLRVSREFDLFNWSICFNEIAGTIFLIGKCILNYMI